MKKIIITKFNILLLLCVLSTSTQAQKIVVGVIQRANGPSKYDISYSVSHGEGTNLRREMELKLERDPQFNYRTDMANSYESIDGQDYVMIIHIKSTNYAHAMGVGFGTNREEALEYAIGNLKSKTMDNKFPYGYDVVYEKDYYSEVLNYSIAGVIVSTGQLEYSYAILVKGDESPNTAAERFVNEAKQWEETFKNLTLKKIVSIGEKGDKFAIKYRCSFNNIDEQVFGFGTSLLDAYNDAKMNYLNNGFPRREKAGFSLYYSEIKGGEIDRMGRLPEEYRDLSF